MLGRGRSSVEANKPSFLKTYTVWRPGSWRCQFRFTDQSDALGKRRGRPGICRARQILVSGQTSKSLWGVESSSWTQPPERHNDETWKGLGNVTVFCVQRHCVLTRTHAVLWAHDSADLPVCHSLIHAGNFEYQNVLSRQTAAVAGQKRAAQWKEPHGYMESACKFSPSGILHLHFCHDLLPKKMKFWSSQIWEKTMLCWIQELSVHTHDAVCGSLWATSRSARDILHYETVGNFCDKHNEYGGKFFLQSSTTSMQECLANLSNFPANYQLPSLKRWCL